jgi:hypothetical protein
MAVQLQPITILSSNYKILTKMLTSWLLPALPSVRSLPSSALFGAAPFQGGGSDPLGGGISPLCWLSDFLFSLDFFHAYDRVCLVWVDCMLKAMEFGPVLHQWISTLRRGVTAS